MSNTSDDHRQYLMSPYLRLALFEAIKHGDEKHQEWLWEAIQAFATGKPIPPPR